MEKKFKNILIKLIRWFGFPKPIKLSEYEIQWIKLCKGHYKDIRYVNAKNWIDTLKPLFHDIYGWNPDEHYNDFLNCMFNKLLDIHLKIKDDKSGSNVQLKNIFNASFNKSIVRDYDLPIERAIAELCGLIQNNLVIENNVERYHI